MARFTITRTPDSFRIIPNDPNVKEFRILQFTDMHYGWWGKNDRKEVTELAEMAKKLNVDLVANTGDMFGHNVPFVIRDIMRGFDKIIGTACPWTFSWGNHDCENFTPKDLHGRLNNLESYFEKLPHCFYRKTSDFFEHYPSSIQDPDAEEPLAKYDIEMGKVGKAQIKKYDGFYGGNFRFEILNKAETQVQWNVFMLNSRQRAHLPPPVMQWMQDELQKQTPKSPSVLFYHVPNYEYHTMWEQKTAHGIKRETVCFEHDKGRVHRFLKTLPGIKGVFVGHDHTNDYWFDKDGIIYSYGRKSGINAYGTSREEPDVSKHKNGKIIKIGAKLIVLSLNAAEPLQNRWDHYSVFPDGTSWRAE